MYRFVLFLGLFSSVVASCAWAQDATPLTIGEPITRDLGAHDAHAYTLDLDAGQFVYGDVDQQTVDVVVTVYGPDDAVIQAFDNPARGPEPFQFKTSAAGSYRVEVTPFQEQEGRYVMRLRLAEPVATTPEGQVDQRMALYGDDTPGGVVAVVKHGEIVFARGYGMANLEYGIPNTPQTPYHMASVSKQFTAFAIAVLADQGKLSLDDPVHKHIPELYDFGQTITLRHLVYHTSGLRDQWNLWVMSGGRMDDVIRQGDLFRLIERQRALNFTPGAEYLYSNTGYMLLAKTVESVTDEDFGDWMQAHVFEPLGMASTQIYDDHERLVPGRAYSYGNGENGVKKSVLSYANSGATSLFTTAEDLARWLRNYRTMAVGGSAVWAQMQERGVLNSGDTLSYAFGLGIGTYRGLRRIQHGGADAGYRTLLAYYPEIDAGVVVLGNLSSFSAGQVGTAVADAFFTEHFEPEPVAVEELEQDEGDEEGMTVASALLDAYAGNYIIEGGPAIEVIREGDGLFAQVQGQPRFALIALSDTLFRIDAPVDVRISFHREPDGRVERGTVYQNGETAIRRVVPWNPDAGALAVYEGRFYSPELETFYTIVVEDSQLVAKHRRHGVIELSSKEEDSFGGNVFFFGDVAFDRDEAGVVTSMRVSNGRVRNLVFEKQEP